MARSIRDGKKHGNCGTLKCAMKGCRSDKNVKNVGRQLIAKKTDIDLSLCRPLKSNCISLRFCSKNHLSMCKKKRTQEAVPRGKRMCMNHEQVCSLWNTLLHKVKAPWAAVLMMVQLCLGERADAARQVRFGWFDDLASPAGEGISIHIPDGLNGKTKARTVQLLPEFVAMLRRCLSAHPLKAEGGTDEQQWPWQGQPVMDKQCCLFPGLKLQRGRTFIRTWRTPVTEKAYYNKLRQAAGLLQAERESHHQRNMPHVWDGAALSKLGTHSMKRTAVVMLKDASGSTAVVSAISGTTAATLDRWYDEPTPARQVRAMSNAFGQIVQQQGQSSELAVCANCGERRMSLRWRSCPFCSRQY